MSEACAETGGNGWKLAETPAETPRKRDECRKLCGPVEQATKSVLSTPATTASGEQHHQPVRVMGLVA